MTNINEQKPLTRANIHEGDIAGHIEHIGKEVREGFDFLSRYPKSVSIFGSSMIDSSTVNYKKAEELGARIARDLKYAVITGGGPGTMEAVNKGAFEAGGISLGLNISLPHEHKINAYSTDAIKFSYFFIRKTMLTFAAEAYVFFPGGFGTMDELFSILTLIQTNKIPKVPVIMFDSRYWNKFKDFVKETILDDFKAIDADDINLFEITDSLDRVIEIIREAPVSLWWRKIN